MTKQKLTALDEEITRLMNNPCTNLDVKTLIYQKKMKYEFYCEHKHNFLGAVYFNVKTIY